ncbi:Hypothetical Protein FCC1311_101962 [Hondaea fermentalgiana]|uniref:Uncharacterized protein n=1 Tax=Hondaea fermentalgiana TaxID=2315210 RepID=A0A2R5GZ00_9STRA|nr:Hypothetical Protein FCC1311_101962 [Hondaea fermentalgiana]|eukprot:GBG33973.1 Hypothetical Protein FCC1311_101962 [Hondaea fermentalgiana]
MMLAQKMRIDDRQTQTDKTRHALQRYEAACDDLTKRMEALSVECGELEHSLDNVVKSMNREHQTRNVARRYWNDALSLNSNANLFALPQRTPKSVQLKLPKMLVRGSAIDLVGQARKTYAIGLPRPQTSTSKLTPSFDLFADDDDDKVDEVDDQEDN